MCCACQLCEVVQFVSGAKLYDCTAFSPASPPPPSLVDLDFGQYDGVWWVVVVWHVPVHPPPSPHPRWSPIKLRENRGSSQRGDSCGYEDPSLGRRAGAGERHERVPQ